MRGRSLIVACLVLAAPLLSSAAVHEVLGRKLKGSGGAFDILAGPNGCSQPPVGVVTVNGFPSSPFRLQPFQREFKNPKSPDLPPPVANSKNGSYKMEYFDIVATEEHVNLSIPFCNDRNLLTPFLLYNKQFPGPLLQGQVGTQLLLRFTNLISPDSVDFPTRAKSWGIPTKFPVIDICKERAERTGNRNIRRGRGLSVHQHGLPTLAPFDGWAEDVTCYQESKKYALARTAPSLYWYHDHALGTTSENTYAGLEAVHIVHPCVEPYGLEGVPMHVVQINDVVFDKDCKLLNDRAGAHFDSLFGDIIWVNGVPWPVFTTKPQVTRFRIVNASVSRVYILKLLNAAGSDVAPDRCHIIGADDGFIAGGPRAWPRDGLHAGTAYRWDVVCDFRGLPAGASLYLYNQRDPARTTSLPPFFCYSHLLMRIDIATEDGKPYSVPINKGPLAANPDFIPTLNVPQSDAVTDLISAAQLAALEQRALKGDADRVIEFGKGGNAWLMNGVGWDTNVPPPSTDPSGLKHVTFDDVGRNTLELWKFKSGGGWVHPIHVHLVAFYVLAVNGKPAPPELARAPKDVIQIGASVNEVIVAARYGPHIGLWMLHCHNGVHEDRDMLRAFLVRDPATGLTALQPSSIFAADGAGRLLGTGVDSNEVPVLNDAEPLAAVAQRYVNKNLYPSFFPVSGIPKTPDAAKTLALLLDRTVNRFLVEVCPAA